MSGRYPPGTTYSDLERAGIVGPDPPECPECGSLVSEGDDHAEDCSLDGLDAVDLRDRETPGADEADRREL